MAKTAAPSTRSPAAFVPGAPCLAEDFREVLEQLNYSACETPDSYGTAHCGGRGWADGAALGAGGLDLRFDGVLNAWETRLDWHDSVDVDTRSVFFGAAVRILVAGTTVEVRLVCDGATVALLTFGPGAGYTAQTATISVYGGGGIGPGGHHWQVDLRRTVGADLTSELVTSTVCGDRIPVADLPDPSG